MISIPNKESVRIYRYYISVVSFDIRNFQRYWVHTHTHTMHATSSFSKHTTVRLYDC